MSPQPTVKKPQLGLIEWLRPGEHARLEQLLADFKRLGITRLRTQFSWADWYTPQGKAWYDWLLPRLARELEVVPCFSYTPPSLGVAAKTSSPPRRPRDYADFIDRIITRLGDHFEWLELWNEPNNLNDWDWRMDPGWEIFCEMVGAAAYWAQQRGKKTVLGGMAPADPHWLDLLCSRGVVQYIDAVGTHGFPGTWEFDWHDWPQAITRIRKVLDEHKLDTELWITETGYSTWRHDEFRQLREFVNVLDAPADRVYWYSLYDLHPDLCHQDGFHEDERHYHFGLKRADGHPKLLFRLWAEQGLDGVKTLGKTAQQAGACLSRNPQGNGHYNYNGRNRGKVGGGRRRATFLGAPALERSVLITGGAGFIGTNLAHRLLSDGERVLIFDNLSRPGVENNLNWLRDTHGENVCFEIADVRDPHLVRDAVRTASAVYHFAAQVAVTTSLDSPREDFEINTRGTLNVLEGLRGLNQPPPLVFTSTNKVYGMLGDLALRRNHQRYEPLEAEIRAKGIDENCALDFHSPYGCSKGAAESYVLDYARAYELDTVTLRMSCIYGPHQHGTEDQGWVAHFLIRALHGEPITLYGDGRQVRDILFVDDMVDALLLARRHISRLKGQAFNIGGGPGNAVSLLEVIGLIRELEDLTPKLRYAGWRTGDQKYYVSDTTRFNLATGWIPSIHAKYGIRLLADWLRAAHSPPLPGLRNEPAAARQASA